MQDPILIAGAGIGGLTAALALLRTGREVRVLEQSDALGEVGAGLTLTPNAGRALASLGLGHALARIGSAPERGEIRHFATGDRLVELPQAPPGTDPAARLYHVHRADLHGLLADAVRRLAPGCIDLESRVTAFEQDGSGVEVQIASGSRVAGSALVGCDGVRSTVRGLVFGDGDPQFTGYVAWRGLVPGERLDAGLKEPPLAMWLGPDRLFIRYRLRGGALCNYVGVAARAGWAEEGWAVRSSRSEFLAEFRDFEPDVGRVIEATPPDTLFRWGIFARQPLGRWNKGRVTLLGDAAHAMPPFLGQGAVMAIEDGVVLGRAFAAAGDVAAALEAYQGARIDRTTAVMRASWECAPLYFGQDPAAQIGPLAASMAAQRESYRYDAASAL